MDTYMNLCVLVVCCVLLVGRGLPAVVAQPASKPLDKVEEETEAEEQGIIANLEKAQQFLQKAGAVHVAAGNCKTEIITALGALSWVETYVLEDEYNQALKQLESAKKALSDCNNALSLANVSNLLVCGSGVCSDGTTCQFTSCGAGKALTTCAFGFAAGVTGGAQGQSYVVTNSNDDPSNPRLGSLRYGVSLGGNGKGGVWITFERDMVIVLKDMLWIRSSTTIDGRGVNVTITGRSVVVGGVTNVILHNFQINSVGESDTVHIFAGSSKVWVDHLTSFQAKLGLVSVVQGSTDVTISNCYLTNPNFNMLLGASDSDTEDKNMRVTVYRNWFRDSMQRMPHCRWGYCHVINNLYTNWGYYAIGARAHAKVVSENNVFIAARRTEITPWFAGAGNDFDASSTIQSSQDLFLNGSTFHQNVQFGTASAPQYKSAAYYPSINPTSTLTALVKRCAGAQFAIRFLLCIVPTRCVPSIHIMDFW
ncbi:hypothetical protein O6H91_17G041800 [Diphasiastrum complanatum]|uniref:Uncharacterized protein n=1 Tax=Diphasiastrum complanatum TaxID=34168 RepID=A0ACC2B619_DIPCM|nr:hypothetical protein O6H91_17G041800 [Diphasiastrum complanatum]